MSAPIPDEQLKDLWKTLRDSVREKSPQYLDEEPEIRSVVAINWGGSRQTVWEANSSNIGDWYCATTGQKSDWYQLQRWATDNGWSMTLLLAAERETYEAGFRAGRKALFAAIEQLADEVEPAAQQAVDGLGADQTGPAVTKVREEIAEQILADAESMFPEGTLLDDGDRVARAAFLRSARVARGSEP